MASIPSEPTRASRHRARSLAWPALVSIPLFLDVVLFFANRPFHRRYFEGELGIIELPTFIVLIVAVAIAAWGAIVRRQKVRRFLSVLALGMFYWAGEEVSWGQTFFHWRTPDAWSKTNYQHEENVHNTKGLVGTLTNQAPRLALDLLAILCVVLVFPSAIRLRNALRDRFGEKWLVPIPAAAAPAALALLAGLINKAKFVIAYKGFGETQELYCAIFLLVYVVGLIRATAPERAETV